MQRLAEEGGGRRGDGSKKDGGPLQGGRREGTLPRILPRNPLLRQSKGRKTEAGNKSHLLVKREDNLL